MSNSKLPEMKKENPELATWVLQDVLRRLESFRQYNGKIAGANILWIKDGISFSYVEYATWAAEFFDLIDEIELEFGS